MNTLVNCNSCEDTFAEQYRNACQNALIRARLLKEYAAGFEESGEYAAAAEAAGAAHAEAALAKHIAREYVTYTEAALAKHVQGRLEFSKGRTQKKKI